MKYSIYKDRKPKDTVKRIKKILEKYNIDTTVVIDEQFESEFRPHSLRVHLKNFYEIGGNGKGTSLENAMASGYGEFIETLQNFNFNCMNRLLDCDLVSPYSDTVRSCVSVEKIIELQKYKFPSKPEDKIYAMSFMNTKDKKKYYIPFDIVEFQATNGLCAGNTFQEAIVHGLSEICERYAKRLAISKKISLPDIPLIEYESYELILNLIKYYNDCGYRVAIKDASIGLGLPVACAVFEDYDNNVFYVNFGCNPSLPVAIERCLTEFAQGYVLKDKHTRFLIEKRDAYPYFHHNFKMIEKSASSMPWICPFANAPVLEHCEYLDAIFCSSKSTYEFTKDSFIDLNKKWNNDKILKFIYKKMCKIEPEIYVRDVSYLGFPSYFLYSPFVSNDVEISEDNIDKFINYFKVGMFMGGDKINEITLDMLFDKLECHTKWGYNKVKSFPSEEYLLLLCSILKNDKENIIAYSDFLIDRKEYDENITDRDVILYKIIKDYYSNDCNEEYIKQNYNEEDVKKFNCLKESLTLKSILQLYNSLNLQFKEKKGSVIQQNILTDVVKNAKDKNKTLYADLKKYLFC